MTADNITQNRTIYQDQFKFRERLRTEKPGQVHVERLVGAYVLRRIHKELRGWSATIAWMTTCVDNREVHLRSSQKRV